MQDLVNTSWVEGCSIKVMPDMHAGKDGFVGLTMKLNGKVNPDFVGSDIGCGVTYVEVPNANTYDFKKLDETIKKFSIDKPITQELTPYVIEEGTKIINQLKIKNRIKVKDALASLGTLGGGNHFIELAKEENKDDGKTYLVVHSGSRNLGGQIYNYYKKNLNKERILERSKELIERYKNEGRHQEINDALKELKSNFYDKVYLDSEDYKNYIHDIDKGVEFAILNRSLIIAGIFSGMGWQPTTVKHTIHNYIEVGGENHIMRKGAVRSALNEELIIPINMRDGSIIARRKGLDSWNNSSPHGAGRIMSRKKAKQAIDIEAFKKFNYV